jgi:two-component system, chemotaxis family, response regulator Rcp1
MQSITIPMPSEPMPGKQAGPVPASRPLRVLLAEDNPGDVLLIQEALSLRFTGVEVSVWEDGEQMMEIIELLENGGAASPDVVLLDLNLPRITGDEVLERLRRSPTCGKVPVIVITSSDSPRDRQSATRLGADRYFRKPTDYDEFMKLGELVEAVLASGAAASQ